MNEQMNEQMNGQMNGQTGAQIDGQMAVLPQARAVLPRADRPPTLQATRDPAQTTVGTAEGVRPAATHPVLVKPPAAPPATPPVTPSITSPALAPRRPLPVSQGTVPALQRKTGGYPAVTRSPERQASAPTGDGGGDGGGNSTQPPPAPLPLAPIPVAPVVIQRVSEGSGTAEVPSPEQESVQAEAKQEQQPPAVNLDQLARDIYPLIKRMIAVERERNAGRH